MSGLRDLTERLAELDDIPSRIAREVSDGINAELADQFNAGTDPYGNAWDPLLPQTVRRKKGDARILRRTDALSSNTIAKPSQGAGVEISSVEYGMRHQGGTVHMVARPILPDGEELPEAWQEVIEKASEKAVRKALRR